MKKRFVLFFIVVALFASSGCAQEYFCTNVQRFVIELPEQFIAQEYGDITKHSYGKMIIPVNHPNETIVASVLTVDPVSISGLTNEMMEAFLQASFDGNASIEMFERDGMRFVTAQAYRQKNYSLSILVAFEDSLLTVRHVSPEPFDQSLAASILAGIFVQ